VKTLARLLAFLGPFARWTALSVLLGVLTVLSGMGLLGTSAYLIASAALHPSVAALEVAIVGVRFFGITRAVFRYLERLVSHSVNFRLLAGLRTWFYNRIEPLAPARLQSFRGADLLARAIADIETLENFYVRAVAPPLVALVVTLFAGWFVGRYDPRLALVLVFALLAAGAGLPLLVYLLNREPGRAIIERRAALNTHLLDLIQGMPDILVYGQGEAQLQRIREAGQALGHAQKRSNQVGALADALALLLSGLALWGVLVLAIPDVGVKIDGVTLAVLALVTLASFEATAPLTQAAQHLESSLHAARRLFVLADAAPEIHPPKEPLPAPVSIDLRIRGVDFVYGEDAPALNDFSLDLPPGRHVALVGPSGAGKTSLFNLLLRFWDYDRGEILLDGRDLRCYDPVDVRRCMAVIPQKPYLFAGTLRQNLLLARAAVDPGELEQVLQQSGLDELVSRLPEGLDTWLGERGVQISGGESQRIALARALLSGAPLLLLDEPTTGLDAASERQVMAAIRQVSAGRSLLLITHRLAGLEEMDELIVLQDGRIAERGRPADLLSSGGIYAKMLEIQNQSLGDL
jgi:ATP-binding cassette, subfamily C, bacterial CydC